MVAGTVRIAYTYRIAARASIQESPTLANRLRLTRTRVAILVVVLAGAAFGGWKATHRGPEPVEVQTAVVQRADLQAKVTANGKIQAQRKVDISATIPGQITHLAVRRGTSSAKGQFLLQIDPAIPAPPRGAARPRSRRSCETSTRRTRRGPGPRGPGAGGGEPQGPHHPNGRSITRGRRWPPRKPRPRRRASRGAGAGHVRRGSRHLVQDGGALAHRRHRHGQACRGGRGGRRRRPEPAGTVLLTVSDMSVVEARSRWTRRRSRPSSSARNRGSGSMRIRTEPSTVVTEVGNSPIVDATGPPNEAIKFKVKIQIKNPPPDVKPGLSVQADILTGFKAQALVVPIQALVVRDIERKPGRGSEARGAARGGGRLPDGGGKARFQAIKTGLLGELSTEVGPGCAAGRRSSPGPSRPCARSSPAIPSSSKSPRRAPARRELSRHVASGAGARSLPGDPSACPAQRPDAPRNHHRRRDPRGRRLGHHRPQRLRPARRSSPSPPTCSSSPSSGSSEVVRSSWTP